jgi:N6-adenosine-specific RNA methylase IME4
MSDPFSGLPKGHYQVIYADPPWSYKAWSKKGEGRSAESHYQTMSVDDICVLPVADLAADNCVLFMWMTWPTLKDALRVINAWGFTYKTCGFDWMKKNTKSDSLFCGMGYWTRSNTEPCLLATKGKPKRQSASVRQPILEPRREHSRKPDCVYERIEKLVDGPYIELFARQSRPGWDSWGNETEKFDV